MTEVCCENFFVPETFLSFPDCQLIQPTKSIGTGISTDSRTVLRGEIFLALQGDNYDGHSFLLDVKDKNVCAIVVQNSNFTKLGFTKNHFPPDMGIYVVPDTLLFYGKLAKKYFDLFSGTRIVVTGSAGKTTVRNYIAKFLALKYDVFQSKKNYNNRVGIPQSIFSISKQYDYFVMEAGISEKGEMNFLGEILCPDIVIITRVLPTHLEGLNTIQGVFQEKSSLVKFLRPFGSCYIPHWDKSLMYGELELPPNSSKIFISQMISSQSVWHKDHGWITKILYKEKQKEICVPFANPFLSKNLSISYAIAREKGVSHETIFENLEKVLSHPARFILLSKQPYLIYDAYNANFYSMMQSIRWILESSILVKKFFLLGDILEMGELEKEIHRQVGVQTRELIKDREDIFIFFIGKSMRNAFDNCVVGNNKQYFFSTREAIDFLQGKIQKDAFYYLKASRGMQFEKICNEVFGCSIT